MHATHHTNRASETRLIHDIEHHVARARRMQAQAIADSLRRRTHQAGHAIGAVQRSFRSHVRFWATERRLGQLSDRSLADIGIPRHAIPLAVRGIDWRTVGADETPWSLRLRSLASQWSSSR